jgi:hypothetical protein
MDTQTSSNSLVAMPTSRPSLDQVMQVIGGERSGEFAPAYMPEYAGLRALPAPMMYAPPQFAAPQFAAPVQQAPVQQEPIQRAPERTFTPFTVPERAPVTAPPKDIYSGKQVITNAPIIGFTAAGDPIYANIPEIKDSSGTTFGKLPLFSSPSEKDVSYLRNPIIGYTPTGVPIYSTTPPPDPYAYGREGGRVSLAGGGMVTQEARGLAALGRGGDNMLVHMSPEEVSGLRALAMQQGTDLTINPDTGLPEAFKLKKLLRALAPIAPFFLGPASGFFSTLAGKALASGIIGGIAAPGKGFNFKEGLKTGLMAYAGGTLAEGFKAQQAAQAAQAGTAGTAGTAAPMAIPTETGAQFAPATTAAPPVDTAAALTPAATAATPMPSDAAVQAGIGGAPVGADVATQAAFVSSPGANVFPEATYAATAPAAATTAGTGAPASNISAFQRYTGVSPSTALIGGTTAVSLLQGEKEREIYEEQERAAREEEERKRRAGLATFERSLGQVPVYGASGGLVALARGGMTYMEAGGTTGPTGEPRMVAGTGDGMSDSVPATIEGVQEARLANDEFVIPADVVADIGNGSSSSGAKKLYDMMDRIRKARHGTAEQPPEIRAEKYMPA